MTTNNIPLDPWQEPFASLTTVPASKVQEASEVLQGFSGSWAASYVWDNGILGDNVSPDLNAPNPRRLKKTKLGDPGHPEINFAPYSYRTNRFGPKGGSLLGHPISFEVVGPTLKSVWPGHYHWTVTHGDGTADGDILTFSMGSGVDPLTVFGIDNLDRYDGGLYIVISQTGDDGPFVGDGGVGDGDFGAVPPAHPAMVERDDTSKYEIFRVVDVQGDAVELDPGKGLSTYFAPGDAGPPIMSSIRAITFLRPKATRMAALPEPGVERGHEKSFVVLTPARALNTDEQYPFQTWVNAGGFVEYWLQTAVMPQGLEYDYRYKPSLPVPRPKDFGAFILRGGAPVAISAGRVVLTEETAGSVSVGDVIHVYDVETHDGAELAEDGATGRSVGFSALLGWFEVVDVSGSPDIVIRRVEEVNPESGVTFFGTPALLTQDTAVTPSQYIRLSVSIHNPITSLWGDSYLDIDAVDSARLTNIIDPHWVERSAKARAVTHAGITPGRADRAVFDTTTGANPGSLMDLGFRMVLFPAKQKDDEDQDGNPISITAPDWDRPITSNEVVLDPSKMDQSQYISVDYSNGIVRLSHAPVDGSDVWPTSTGDDNPQDELILFCCCVPYSMEEGQLGSGVRATGSASLTYEGGCNPNVEGTPEHADVYSGRYSVPLRPQTVDSIRGGVGVITLEGWVADQIPPSGFVELLAGTTPYGDPLFSPASPPAPDGARGSLFGYYAVNETMVGPDPVTELLGIYGGGDIPSNVVVSDSNPAVAVWRREFATPQTADGMVSVPYQYDTTYGSAKRATTVRYEFSHTRVNADGSISIINQNPSVEQHTALFDDLFSSWLISGGSATAGDDGAGNLLITVASSVVIKDGVRQEVPETSTTVAGPGLGDVHYAYYTSATPGACVTLETTTSLPLPSEEDILIGKIKVTGLGPVAADGTDLRAPLQDIDKRVDIYVGEREWSGSGYAPHFSTLAEAVTLINEIGEPEGGSDGIRQFRIFVVGPTTENQVMSLGVDGVLIESASRTSNNYPATPATEITWDRRAPLIDTDGHSDIVLRGLSARSTMVAPTSADTNGAFLLTNTNTVASENVSVEKCRGVGLDGFMTADQGGEGFKYPRVTQCVGLDLFTSGVSVPGLGTEVMDFGRIKDNVFWADSSVASWATTDTGHGIDVKGAGNEIDGNNTLGFNIGIKGTKEPNDTDGFSARNNHVVNTKREGIYVEGRPEEISFNTLLNVAQDAPAPADWWTGMTIDCTENKPQGGFDVVGNLIYVPADFTGGKRAGILIKSDVDGGRGNIQRNDVYRLAEPDAERHEVPCVLWGSDCVLDNNSNFWIVWGSGNRITGNTLPKLHVNFDYNGWNWAQYKLILDFDGFNYLGFNKARHYTDQTRVQVVLGYKTIVEGNEFYGYDSDPALGTGLYVTDDCWLTNNYIAHLKTPYHWPPAAGKGAADSTLVGNSISHLGEDATGVENGVFRCTRSIWQANRFLDVDTIVISGGETQFVGNYLVAQTNLSDPRAWTFTGTNFIFEGNFINGSSKNDVNLSVTGDAPTVVGNGAATTVTKRIHLIVGQGIETIGGVVSGNKMGTLHVLTPDCSVSGNKSGYSTSSNLEALIVEATGCTVGTNRVKGNLIVRPQISGGVPTPDCVLTGNRIEEAGSTGGLDGSIRVECDQSLPGTPAPPSVLLSGNWCEQSIQLWDLDSGGGAPGEISPAGTGMVYSTVGNRVGPSGVGDSLFTDPMTQSQYPAPANIDTTNIT